MSPYAAQIRWGAEVRFLSCGKQGSPILAPGPKDTEALSWQLGHQKSCSGAHTCDWAKRILLISTV